MKTTTTFILAAVTALTLGFGTAMAQSEVPSMQSAPLVSGQHQAAPKIIIDGAGSSDALPAVNFDFTTLANPG